MRDTGMVSVSLVICTSTDIVHPTRLTDSIPVSVSNASIYEALLPLLFEFGSYLLHLADDYNDGCAILGWR
jgi:hypothetical protein